MRAPGLAALLWLCMSAAQAGTVQRSIVVHHGHRYTLDFVAQVDAGVDEVYTIVSDFEQVSRLSKTIIEASLLPEPMPDVTRRRLVLRSCMLFYCFRVHVVEDIVQLGDRRLVATVLPEQSDFIYGLTEWHFSDAEGGTRIALHSEQEPRFWIPPFIGPWVIQRRMQAEAQRVVKRIEALAHD